MRKKCGITMTSVVVYVTLLATFTGIALSVSNNLSVSMFEDKGIAINAASFDKILYYLNKAAMESTTVTSNEATITFSNGDVFSYNAETNAVIMNGGILCKNVYAFGIEKQENGILNVTITLKKYTHNMERTINLYVGE